MRRILRDNNTVDVERLSNKHGAPVWSSRRRLSPASADLPEAERALLFAGHSPRADLASADIEERFVQKQLGDSSAEMTRKSAAAGSIPDQPHQGEWTLGDPAGVRVK